jgi:hypothetical protein
LLEPKHQRRAEITFFFFYCFRLYEGENRSQSGCNNKCLLNANCVQSTVQVLSLSLTTCCNWYSIPLTDDKTVAQSACCQ